MGNGVDFIDFELLFSFSKDSVNVYTKDKRMKLMEFEIVQRTCTDRFISLNSTHLYQLKFIDKKNVKSADLHLFYEFGILKKIELIHIHTNEKRVFLMVD
jgi:hypothetical protein